MKSSSKNDDFIPQCIPNISGNERKYLEECVDSTFVSSVGKFVNSFESLISRITNYEFCEAVSSGTNGLHLGLEVLGVGTGDLVIIPTYTFVATANSVSHCKAQPWLFDIDEETLNLDLDLVAKALEEECEYKDKNYYHKKTNQRIAAIMPVLCLGYPLDYNQLKTFKDKYNIPMILDSAAALGSTFDNQNLGLSSAEISVLSFNGNKTFTSGGGGSVMTNNEKIYEQINHRSTTARIGKDYIHDQVGFNYRMTNLQAAVGVAQLERYEEFIKKKKFIQSYYVDNISLPYASYKQTSEPRIDSVRWLSHLYLAQNSSISSENITKHLLKKNIEARGFWIPMHKQPPYKNCLANLNGTSEKIYKNLIILPSSTNLEIEHLERVVDAINSLA